MQLANIDAGKLFVSKTNMRHAEKTPDVSDILPSIRERGVIVPLVVRPGETMIVGDDPRRQVAAVRPTHHTDPRAIEHRMPRQGALEEVDHVREVDSAHPVADGTSVGLPVAG